MLKLTSFFLSLISLFFATAGINPVLAQTCSQLQLPGGYSVSSPIENCNLATPGGIISIVLPLILGIAAFITVIVIILSGIQFITSGGNPEAAAAARGRLTFALIGLVLIILAFAILQIVDRLFLGGSGVV